MLTLQLIASLATVTIALCALGFTIWQGVQTRRHNKLSVTPYLATWTNMDHIKKLYSVELLNNGIGPARIKSFSIIIDGQRIDGKGAEPIQNALNILFPDYKYETQQSFIAGGYWMSEKEKRTLVSIHFLGPSSPSPDKITNALKKSQLIIDYDSIYNDKFTLKTNLEGSS